MEYRYSKRPKKTYSKRRIRPEKDVLLRMLEGRTREAVAVDLKVSKHTITNWLIFYNVRQPRVRGAVSHAARLEDEMAHHLIPWSKVAISSAQGINGAFRGMACQI